MESPKIRAVVFDLDGLMFNTEELYQRVGSEMLRRRGKTLTADLLDAMMGRPNHISLQTMIDWHGLEATVPQLIAETDSLFPALLDAHLSPMPGVVDMLGALEKAGLPKAIATSSRRTFTLDLLGRFSFTHRFDHILTAEDVTQGKPHPEVYLLAASKLGVAPPEMLVFEDSQTGCTAAAAAGAVTVAVPGGHSRQQNFAMATLVADSIGDPRVYALLGLPTQ